MTTGRGLLLALLCGYLVTGPVTARALENPTVLSIVTPSQAQEISGEVSLWAATDGLADLVSMRFQVDGQNYGQPITSGLYRTTWDSRKATDGLHTVQAIGQDKFGNTLLSAPVTFFVNNFAPSRPTPTPAPEAARMSTPLPTPVATPTPVPANDASAAMASTAAAAPAVSAASSTALTPRGPVSCKQPDPFKVEGGIGMCVGGEWVLLWKPRKKN